MYAKTTTAVAIFAIAGSVSATVFPTAPVAATSWKAGTPQTIRWQESTTPTPPTLATFGNASIAIYTGNRNQQTLLQLITPSINVGTENSITFTPDPEIGPDGSEYFIRFESRVTQDPLSPQFPALAFSSKFELTDMTGQFNTTVQAQIDGQATAPIGGSAPTGTNAAAGGANSSPTGTRSTTAPSGFSTNTTRPNGTNTASAANSTKTSGNAATAIGVKGSIAWAGALVGALIGAALF